MKAQHKSTQPIFYLYIFLSIALFLIIVSLLFKFIMLIRQSSFNGDVFTGLIIDSDMSVFQIKKKTHEASFFVVKNMGRVAMSQSRLSNSILIGIPLNAIIYSSPDKHFKSLSEIFSMKNTVGLFLAKSDIRLKGMTELDFVNLYNELKSISEKAISTSIIEDYKKSYHEDLETTNNLLYQMFKVGLVINDITSIEVVNGTGIDGMGARVSQMIKNSGYNVVSTTSSEKAPRSKIVMRISNQRLEKHLGGFFSFPVEKSNEAHIADVSIVLGKDSFQELSRIVD